MVIRLDPTTADDGTPVPRFEITPKVWLVGDPKLDIRVVNLKPNQKVTVVSQMGKQVSRRIEGVADAKGQFDLRGTAEPGPKTGAPFRVLWDTKEDPAVEPIKERGVHFRAEIDGSNRDGHCRSVRLDEAQSDPQPVRTAASTASFTSRPARGRFPAC
jgi:hypothetical protein